MASTIKVDNVQNQPGTNVINKCGTTVTVGAGSDNIRSAGNNLQASDGGNLISQSGTTITLGASGDTVTLASGASQTGFGRTGTVDWQTGDIKTGTFTAVSGKGYFVAETKQECLEYISTFDSRINAMIVSRDALQYQMKIVINLFFLATDHPYSGRFLFYYSIYHQILNNKHALYR